MLTHVAKPAKLAYLTAFLAGTGCGTVTSMEFCAFAATLVTCSVGPGASVLPVASAHSDVVVSPGADALPISVAGSATSDEGACMLCMQGCGGISVLPGVSNELSWALISASLGADAFTSSTTPSAPAGVCWTVIAGAVCPLPA